MSLDYLTPYSQIQLGCRGQIGADQIYVIQLDGTVFTFRVDKVEQRRAAVLVGKQNRVAHANRLVQVLALVRLQQTDIAAQGGVGGIDIGVDLGFDAFAQLLVAFDVNFRTQLLALVAVEEAERDADAGADGVGPGSAFGGG